MSVPSDQGEALSYLRFLQAQSYYALEPGEPYEIRAQTADDLIQIYGDVPEAQHLLRHFEHMNETLLRDIRRLPDHQRAAALWSNNLQHLLERAARFCERRPPKPPVVGLLPTGRMNAMTFLVPGSTETLIVFEDQLFMFAWLFCKLVLTFYELQPVEKDVVEPLLPLHPASDVLDLATKRFDDLFSAYLLRGQPRFASPYALSEPAHKVAGLLTRSFETFVMGHEYAHFILGHHAEQRVRQVPIGSATAQEIETNWQKEHLADLNGLVATLAADQADGLACDTSFRGADCFLRAVDLVERSLSIVFRRQEIPEGTDTHPPAYLRRRWLHAQLKDRYPGVFSQVELQAEGIDSVLLRVWERFRVALARTDPESLHWRWKRSRPAAQPTEKQDELQSPGHPRGRRGSCG